MAVATETDVQIGAGHIYALATILVAISSTQFAGVIAYLSPNLKTLRATHSGTIDRIKNQAGVTSSIIGNDDMLECAFDFIPEGATRALARSSAALPKIPSAVTISGAPVIPMGPFADALNTAGLQPWIYEGNGTINGTDDLHWTGTFTLHRYQGITSTTIIT